MRINDIEVGWGQVSVTSTADLGIGEDSLVLSGVSGITFSKKRVMDKQYGLGKKAYARGLGNEECEASITFKTSVQQALRAQNGRLMELGAFDLTIAYNSEFEIEDVPTGSNVIIIKDCMFNEDGSDWKQGDTSSEKTFDLNPMDILFGRDATGND